MSEEETVKAIIVTRDHGGVQRYAAMNFGMLHDGTLVIGDKVEGDDLRVDAMIAPGRWVTACKDGAELHDDQAEALGIARGALNRIWSGLMTADDPANVAAMRLIVDEALSTLVDLGFE